MSSTDITSSTPQQPQAQINATANAPVQSTLPTSSSAPFKISPNSHLDPSSYVKGKYQLTIEANSVIHPRTYLFTELGPLTVRSGSIIAEKCVIGRRDKTESSSTHQRNQASTAKAPLLGRRLSTIEDGAGPGTTEAEPGSIPTLPEIVIGPNAHLHASVTIQAPSTINDSVILEPGVMISPNCSIGAHSKICAGITVPPGTSIPEWTVVYGMNGQMRRRRRGEGEEGDVAEEARLEVLKCERAGVDALLKMNAGKNLAQGGAGGVGTATGRSKRESMIRG